MASDPLYDAFARTIAGPAPGRAPRNHPTVAMNAVVTAVDYYQCSATVNIGGVDVPGIRVAHLDTLRPGDVAILSITGPGVSLVGRQARLDTTPPGVLT